MAIVVICKSCNGTGKIKALPLFPVNLKCFTCKGTGKQNESIFKTE